MNNERVFSLPAEVSRQEQSSWERGLGIQWDCQVPEIKVVRSQEGLQAGLFSPGEREGGQQPQLGGPGQPHHGLQVLPDCEAGLVVVQADVEPVGETEIIILTFQAQLRWNDTFC